MTTRLHAASAPSAPATTWPPTSRAWPSAPRSRSRPWLIRLRRASRACARRCLRPPRPRSSPTTARCSLRPRSTAVVISSPQTLHYEQVLDALDRGLHVLCEKPLVFSVRETHEIIARGNAKKPRRWWSGYRQRRFMPVTTARCAEFVRDPGFRHAAVRAGLSKPALAPAVPERLAHRSCALEAAVRSPIPARTWSTCCAGPCRAGRSRSAR